MLFCRCPRRFLRELLLNACAAGGLAGSAAFAADISLSAPGADETLRDTLVAASSVVEADARGQEGVQELLAAALADYRTMVQVLYDAGHFSPVVNIRLDGREAASIQPLNPPSSIAEIEIADDGIVGLQAQLDALSGDGFHLVVEEAGDDAAPDGAVFEIELLGPDHPGIVRDISHCLAERGVSVEDMDTDIREAPHAGGTLFHAHARLRAPAGLSDDDLRDSLEILAETLMVDITVGKIL